MKKCYYLTLLCVLASMACFGQGEGLPSNYMGNVAGQYESFYRKMVGFTLPEGRESLYALESPADGATLVSGTWAEDKFVGSWKYGSEEYGFYYVYKSYHPITKEWQDIGEGTIETAVGKNIFDMAYDYTTQKVYTVAGSVLYSNDLSDETFTEIGTLTGGISLRSIACNKAGILYAIVQEGGAGYYPSEAQLYRIDKTTAEATFIGNLGVQIAYYDQAATFDYNTDELYIHCSSDYAADKRNFYRVNVTTGEAAEIMPMRGISIAGLTSVFYTKNVPPGKAIDLTLAVNAADNNRIELSFGVPTVDINGESSNSAAKAVVHKKNAVGVYEIVETIDPVAPGSIMAKQYIVPGEGKYTFAIEILTAEDRSSGLVSQEVSNIAPIMLPYENDFSTPKPNVVVIVAEEGNVFFSPDRGTDNSPCYGFKKGTSANRMDIVGIPMEKGCTYALTFDVQTTASYSASFYYTINGLGTYFSVARGDYQQFEFSYVAPEDFDDAVFSLYKQYDSGTDTIFIDNVVIKEIAPATVPAKTSILNVTAAPLGEMKAFVKIITPDKDMAGNPLTDLSGIRVEYTTSFFTMANHGIRDIAVAEIGEEITLEVPVIHSKGSYYFQVSAYNSQGICYDKTRASFAIWIGEDSSPRTPRGLTIENTDDNKILLAWQPVIDGTNGGYVNKDEITYSVSYSGGGIPSGNPVVTYNITDTHFSVPSLPLGAYAFGVKAHYKTTLSTESSIRIIHAGADQAIIANTSKMSYSFEDYPFVSNDYTASDVSGISQTIYTVEEMGGAMYINDFYFFVSGSSLRDLTLDYKVSLGYKETGEFSDKTDFVDKNQLREVYNGPIHFGSGTNILIPTNGFYYDGTKPLLIQMTKTYEGKNSVDVFVNETGDYRSIVSKSTAEDVGAINDPVDYPGTNYFRGVASLVINRELQLSTISGTIISEETGLPVEGATVHIISVSGEHAKPLDVKVITDANGKYNFDLLPYNEYNVTISASGYVDYTDNFIVEEVEDITLDVELEGANKIKIEGKVVNANDNVLEGVTVILSKVSEEEQTTTAADGTFSFMAYGSTTYVFSFTKTGMIKLEESHGVLIQDTLFDPFVMRYETVPVSSVNAVLEQNGKATINWTASNPVPVNGYRVYRGTGEQIFEEYTELTTAPVTGTTFNDESLAGIEYGVFKYAVCTDWYGGDLSAPVYSAVIEKDMNISAVVNVKTNGASPEGALLVLSNAKNTYNAVADENGSAVFNNTRRDTYSLTITLPYHKELNMHEVVVNSTAPIDSDVLEELTDKPVIGSANSIENIIEIDWSITNTVNPTGFKVYLDDVKKADLEASVFTYTCKDLKAGDYTVGITAVFASGESEMVTKSVSVEGLVMPIHLDVKIITNSAEFTWAPGGFASPKHYEIYLDGELKADNITTESYTFENLPDKDYTAGVVAVYENGKSGRAEKSFTISYVGIEEIFSVANVFPNPSSSGNFTLVVPAPCTVKVYDVRGRMITERNLPVEGIYQLDLSGQDYGFYFLQFINSEIVRTINIIFN